MLQKNQFVARVNEGWKNQWLQALLSKKWTFMLLVIAFLLGRAMILEQLTPFYLAYFTVIYFMRRDLLYGVALVLLLGNFTSIQVQTLSMLFEMGVMLLLLKGLEKYERSELSYAPILVFLVSFLTGMFQVIVLNELTWFALMLIAVESALGFILTLIFIQAIPVFTFARKNYNLKSEEIICLIILLASVMTGTKGWMIGEWSVEHILSRYLILLFAIAGGAALGAAVGVVTGLILSLASVEAISQISLLAFSGLLAGLLKEGRKLGVSFGLLIGCSILSIYLSDKPNLLATTWESLFAIGLFLLTPKQMIQTLAKFVPGSNENLKSQFDYAKRVRDVTAERVQSFSEVFRQLSHSFRQFTNVGETLQREEDMGHFMDSITQKACSTCWKKKQCWDDQFNLTYRYLTDMMTAIELDPRMGKREIPIEWKQRCVKTEQVLGLMKMQYEQYKHDLIWKKQIYESRHLVADQLFGVSQVMDDLVKEIKREGHEMYIQEELIRNALEELGLSIMSIDIISLEVGKVEIEVVHQYTRGFDECRKIIAPLLSDILGEHIAVKSEQFTERGDGYYIVMFGSAKGFEVDTGIAGAAKGGQLLSGDSFSTVELSNGKFAVAVSDGMGNGERARMESSSALSILQQLLESGMDEKLAIKSVNSVLLLRSSDEVFATIDVALIDLNDARTTFLKNGSTPSFIKRGNEVICVSANNLPVGIVQEIDVDLISVQLQPEDILIMFTDGVYDAPGHAVNKELWMKRMIQEIEATEAQDIADCLLETIVRYQQGDIHDDMTVVVAKLGKSQPEWATLRWQMLTQIERPKIVS